MSQRSRFAPLSRDDSDTEEQEDNPADDDLLDALELDLAGEALTLVDTVDPTVNDDIVQDGSGSDGDAETVISEGPDPGAQADRSSEPEMAVSQVVPEVRPSARTQAGFAALDVINVRDIFTQRACVMKVPPAFLRGAYRSAMRTALLEITSGMELSNNTRVVRGWKLFVLLPRMLLFKPPRGGKVSKNVLLDRFTKFAQGQWLDLLTQSVAASAAAIEMRSRRRRTGTDSVEKRAERAEALVCLGEISTARRALEASPVAPGTEAT